jgi:hypothetical protein
MTDDRSPDCSGKRLGLPIRGSSVVEVVDEGLPTLKFDDPKRSILEIHGEFWVEAAGTRDRFKPRERAALPVLESLQLVLITEARASRRGVLEIRFSDGRVLTVPDGPFENWHYTNADGYWVHGGVGRVVMPNDAP